MKNVYFSLMGRSYLYSKHRTVYESLAERFQVVPGLVYLIAHGRSVSSSLEYDIARALFTQKVTHHN